MPNLAGKVALVTGATGGIGRETAKAFVDGGARVVLADLDEAALRELAKDLGSAAAIAVCDVTREDHAANAVAVAQKAFGRLDIAVLNAGTEGRVGMIGDLSLDDFDRVMNVNVRGVFIGLTHIMPVMKQQKGGVICILSSTAGRRGSPGLSPYVTSKHAVVGLMKSAALEGAPDGVRVLTVNPGPIETRMMRAIEQGANPADPASMKSHFSGLIPMQRYGTPQEVAAMIAFLTSDAASYCTGNIYAVDGGFTTE